MAYGTIDQSLMDDVKQTGPNEISFWTKRPEARHVAYWDMADLDWSMDISPNVITKTDTAQPSPGRVQFQFRDSMGSSGRVLFSGDVYIQDANPGPSAIGAIDQTKTDDAKQTAAGELSFWSKRSDALVVEFWDEGPGTLDWSMELQPGQIKKWSGSLSGGPIRVNYRNKISSPESPLIWTQSISLASTGTGGDATTGGTPGDTTTGGTDTPVTSPPPISLAFTGIPMPPNVSKWKEVKVGWMNSESMQHHFLVGIDDSGRVFRTGAASKEFELEAFDYEKFKFQKLSVAKFGDLRTYTALASDAIALVMEQKSIHRPPGGGTGAYNVGPIFGGQKFAENITDAGAPDGEGSTSAPGYGGEFEAGSGESGGIGSGGGMYPAPPQQEEDSGGRLSDNEGGFLGEGIGTGGGSEGVGSGA